MEAQDKIKKIIFFHSPSEIDEYIRNTSNTSASPDNEVFIAMTPSCYSHLKRNGIRAQNTLKYFTNNSHMELLEKSNILVDWLRRNSDFVDLGIGVRQSIRDSFIFWIRCAIHYCLWDIEIVLNAVNEHKPDCLLASFSGKKMVSSLYIEPEEKYLGYIVKTVAKIESLEYKDISDDKISDFNLPRLPDSAALTFKTFLRHGRFQLWQKWILAKSVFNDKGAVFFTTARNMDGLVNSLRYKKLDFPFYFLKGPIIPHLHNPNFITKILWNGDSKVIAGQKNKFKDLEKRIEEEPKFFSYRGISFADIISEKIRENTGPYILGLIMWLSRIDKFIDKSKAKAFISDGERLDDMILAELCMGKRIPDILISHGSFVRPKNRYEQIEWREQGSVMLNAPFSHLVLQSPLSEGYLDAFSSKGKVVKTGPLVWGRPVNLEKSERVFNKMFEGKYDLGRVKVILHAGTPKPSKALRLYVYETPDEYIQSICDLANAVERIPNALLVVKFRPRFEIGIDDLKRLVPFSDKVIPCVNESFNDVLGMSDLLVSFSSTAIEEALQNRIPVLLYGGGGRYQHISAYEIKGHSLVQPSAVYYVKKARDLEYSINRILNLNIDREKDGNLFEPYIYAKHERVSLVELIESTIR